MSVERVAGGGFFPIGVDESRSGEAAASGPIGVDESLAISAAIGIVSETDSALAISFLKSGAIGLATEADSALAITVSKATLVGLATETDEALAIVVVKSATLGIASETDSVFSLTFATLVPLGIATETGTAFPLAGSRILGIASETGSALAIVAYSAIAWPGNPANPITPSLLDVLRPRHIGIHPVAMPIGGGVALTGKEPVIVSNAGYWRIVYGGVPIKTRAAIQMVRELEVRCEGRGNLIDLPIWDGKRAPWVVVGGTITATANAAAAQDATTLDILVTVGGTLQAGMHFSHGVRLYRVKSVNSVAGSVYTVTIWPKLRAPIAATDVLDFVRPILRVRLEDDAGLTLPLRLHRFSELTIGFVEAL